MPVLRLAHRGDWRHAPENSIGAFLAALDVPGCDGVEFDVRMSRDGVPVCYHDETLRRLHRVDRAVADLDVVELEQLGIVRLDAALEAIPRRAFLDVELKGDPGRAAFEALVAGRGPLLERAVVSSFRVDALRRIAGWAPSWGRWLNTDSVETETVAQALELGCTAIAVEWHALDARTIDRIRDAGLDVVAWTVRQRATYGRLARLGVSAMCVEAAALDG
jgi:glycerophosphoryl diester phosphodiesterase